MSNMATLRSSTIAFAAKQRPSPRAGKATKTSRGLSSKASVVHNFSLLKRSSPLKTGGHIVSTGRSALQIRAKKTQWPEAFEYLDEAQLKSVPPADAAKLMKKGWVLIDCRPGDLYDESRAAGSKSAALYQSIDPKSALQWARFALFKSMEVKPVEENPKFLDDAAEAIKGAKGVIIACSEGGTLEPTWPSFPTGKTSRSLVAAYLMLSNGVAKQRNLVHLQGGLNGWFRADLPGEGPEEWTFDARTPSEAPPAQYSAAYNKRGEKQDKSRTALKNKSSGTLMKDGGNPLDPFGGWSMLKKKK